MVLALTILKLNVQTVLNPDIHLDATVRLGRYSVAVDPDLFLAHDVGHAPRDEDADVVAQLDIDTVIGLVLLFHGFKVEGEGLRVLQVAGRRELLREGKEFVVGAAVVVHFC